MEKIPAFVLRPTETADGEGGFDETYEEPRQVFLEGVAFHNGIVTVVVDALEDVRENDVLQLEDKLPGD